MKTQLQVNDDIVIQIKENSVIEIFEYEDYELNNPTEMVFAKGDELECTILECDDHKIDVQFFNGTVAFLRHSIYEVVSIN